MDIEAFGLTEDEIMEALAMEVQLSQEWEVEVVNERMIVDGRDIGSAEEIVRNMFGYELGVTVAEYIKDGGTVIFRADGCMWANE
jgi:hypothetical protein